MTAFDRGDESHSLRGEIDRRALRQFCDVFERVEPLATGEIVGPIKTTTLQIELEDGIGRSSGGRFDVRWSVQDDYNVHYSNGPETDLRWDVHPHEYTAPDGDAHFHPPPRASNRDGDVEGSCLEVDRVPLVAIATAKLWRTAYDAGTLEDVNGFENPP